MIFPQNNSRRYAKDLSGAWDFRKDPQNLGLKKRWHRGFNLDRSIAVPASWNEQCKDLRDYLGPAWYQKAFTRPSSSPGRKTFLRFGSVNYMASVWLNGVKLGTHEGGHLPFVFELTPHLKKVNRLVVRVEGFLKPDRVPPGNVPPGPLDSFNNNFNPPASFDFFPYCGIQRPVWLYTTPKRTIQDLTVVTSIAGKDGKVAVEVLTQAAQGCGLRLSLEGFGWKTQVKAPVYETKSKFFLRVPRARFWAPGSPNL